MFDPTAFVLGGVQLIALVFGLTQFVKTLLSWEGQKVTVLAASLGALLMVVYRLVGIVPEPYGQIVDIAVNSLAFGLSASGYYKFFTRNDLE